MLVYVKINQEAAIKAGENVFGIQCVDINPADLSPAQRDELAQWAKKSVGNDSVRQPYISAGWSLEPQHSPMARATPETVIAAIDELIIDREKLSLEKAEKLEADTVEWLALPTDKKIDSIRDTISGDFGLSGSDPRVSAERARLEGVISARKKRREAVEAEAKIRHEKMMADLAAKEKETNRRKAEQLADVVMRLGTPLQREKWGAGFMSRSEALELLWRETFPVDGALKNEWHPVGYDEEGEEIIADEETFKRTLTDEQYSAMKAIAEKSPDANTAVFHQHNCGNGVDILRLTKCVGEYILEADFIL